MPGASAPTARQQLADRFVARHGPDAYEAVLEQLDEFLGLHKLSCLSDTLAVAPIFGDLLGRSRKQCQNALVGIRDGEEVWMIVVHEPQPGRPQREFMDVRAMVGAHGRLTISFEHALGAGT